LWPFAATLVASTPPAAAVAALDIAIAVAVVAVGSG
jgi:hypothetical protein